MAGHSPEAIRAETRKYMLVFAALAVLTVVTVAVSYLDLTPGPAVALAMVVASVKGGLVAAYFMHLLDEQKVIYWVLVFTVIFFVVLMLIPSVGAADGTGAGIENLYHTPQTEGEEHH